ncbi:hypothetical protein AAG570_006275 [Ranatra chinensis]|uniref:Digestive organ expansion factor-like protein n=1 Tax=Ranatra chinensis TaxID=642074 RepID=A0ABD0ZGQ7_9HEMI
MLHFNRSLTTEMLAALATKPPPLVLEKMAWPTLGGLHFTRLKVESMSETKKTLLEVEEFATVHNLPQLPTEFTLDKVSIKSQICENIIQANEKFNSRSFTDLQKELLTILSNYQDIYFPERNFTNGEEIRFIYCVHTINHVLKSRLKVLHHDTKLLKKSDVPEEFRDQGLVRPKILILVPFKDSALRVVKTMQSILLGEGTNVMNRKRFIEEYSGPEIVMPQKNQKPVDYQLLFNGNIDDNFRIGISVTKKCLKLYADFYSSDIIVASPLGLRMLIGAEGEKDRDYDFLASIEILIMDQAQVFTMQNWEHVLHVIDHLHLQPKEAHGTDLARVRLWGLNGWSKYYRQSVIFCSHPMPEITALFNVKCSNYGGKIAVVNSTLSGSICKVAIQIPQMFHYINATSVLSSIDARFSMFTNKILPQYRDPTMKHTVIYVPSYFDYVKIRNYFKKYDISFVQICEYSKDGKIARARDMFYHGSAHFLLYSERFHFFRRIHLRGMNHIIFYQPPSFPAFYSEMCNLMQVNRAFKMEQPSEMTVNVLYSKYDAPQLSGIVGSERATRMLASEKSAHVFMTDS